MNINERKNVSDLVISTCVDTEGELSEAEGYMKAMEIECRTLPSADKKFGLDKLAERRAEYKEILQRYQTVKFNAEAQALKGGPNAKTKLVNANQKLDQSTLLLEQSRSMLANTEEVGSKIITDMGSQKEQLLSAQSKVKETRQFTLDAKTVLRAMGNRAIMHKVCVVFTIIVLAGAIVGIGYYGFSKK